jgi:hypothetical protein
LDVKTAYLNGDIGRELYIQQPPGFEVEEQEARDERGFKGAQTV